VCQAAAPYVITGLTVKLQSSLALVKDAPQVKAILYYLKADILIAEYIKLLYRVSELVKVLG
jgi:hypothetical protein